MSYSIASTGGGNTDTVPLNEANNATYGDPMIQSMKVGKESQIMKIPIPTEDSDKALGYDLLGVIREIYITGKVTGTITQLKEFIFDIEGKVFGNQYSNTNNGHTFNTDMAGTGATSYYVIITAFNWTYSFGAPNKIDYTLNMMQVDNS